MTGIQDGIYHSVLAHEASIFILTMINRNNEIMTAALLL